MILDIAWIVAQMAFYGSGIASSFQGNQLYTYGGMRFPDAESSIMSTVGKDYDTHINRAYVEGWVDNGYFYTLGGRENFLAKDTFYRTELSTYQTETLSPMGTARISFCYGTWSTPQGLEVIVVGGYKPNSQGSSINQHTDLPSVEQYRLNTNQWNYLPDYPAGDITHCMGAVVGEYLYVLGGMKMLDDTTASRYYYPDIWRISHVTGVWENVGQIFTPFAGGAAIGVGGEIVYLGGHNINVSANHGFKKEVYVYDTVTQQSRQLPTLLPIEGHDIDIARSASGELVIVGGEIEPYPPTKNKTNAMRVGTIKIN